MSTSEKDLGFGTMGRKQSIQIFPNWTITRPVGGGVKEAEHYCKSSTNDARLFFYVYNRRISL